jgi:hypothetical protein
MSASNGPSRKWQSVFRQLVSNLRRLSRGPVPSFETVEYGRSLFALGRFVGLRRGRIRHMVVDQWNIRRF